MYLNRTLPNVMDTHSALTQISVGLRVPLCRRTRRGAPYTYVTTDKFLVAFDLETLQVLPDREQLEDAGLGAA